MLHFVHLIVSKFSYYKSCCHKYKHLFTYISSFPTEKLLSQELENITNRCCQLPSTMQDWGCGSSHRALAKQGYPWVQTLSPTQYHHIVSLRIEACHSSPPPRTAVDCFRVPYLADLPLHTNIGFLSFKNYFIINGDDWYPVLICICEWW